MFKSLFGEADAGLTRNTILEIIAGSGQTRLNEHKILLAFILLDIQFRLIDLPFTSGSSKQNESELSQLREQLVQTAKIPKANNRTKLTYEATCPAGKTNILSYLS